MATKLELREASRCAESILSGAMIADGAAADWERTNEQAFAKRFVKGLYDIEDSYSSWRESNYRFPWRVMEDFAAVNQVPVMYSGIAMASAHDAIIHLAINVTGISFAVVNAAIPGHYKPGVEYLCPELLAETDMLEHVAVAVRAFRNEFPSWQSLNTLSVVREQELARALRLADGPDEEPTETPQRASGYRPRSKDAIAIVEQLEKGVNENAALEELTWAKPGMIRQVKKKWLDSRDGS